MEKENPACICADKEKYLQYISNMRLDYESKFIPLEKVERTACNDMLKEFKLKIEEKEKSIAGIKEGSVKYTLMYNQINRLEKDIEDQIAWNKYETSLSTFNN